MEVLVSDIKVYQSDTRQTVFSIHDRRKKQALRSDTTVWPPKERKQTIKKAETTAASPNAAGNPPSLETVRDPCLLSVVRGDGWVETDVLGGFRGSFLPQPKEFYGKVKNVNVSPFQLAQLHFHRWK